MTLELNKLYLMDCMEGMAQLPNESINCCVTSPPYYGLRDYSNETVKFEPIQYSILGFTVNIPEWEGQLGLEPTLEMYVGHIVQIFREVKRVLKKDGTLWLNLGDSYANSGTGGQGATGGLDKSTLQSKMPPPGTTPVKKKIPKGLKAKDLIGIPWMVAFALRSDGWYLRSDIIWDKPNPMPESVTDRPTKSHEYIFLLAKSKKYYYDADAIKTEMADTTIKRLMQDTRHQKGSDRVPGKTNGPMKAVGKLDKQSGHGRRHAGFNKRWKDRKGYDHRGDLADKKFRNHSGNYDENGNVIGGGKANKRSVWHVAIKPFKEAHFAVYPQELIIDCIKAGCPEGGIVLDPFAGANTTGIVARKLNRNYISIELNPKYKAIADKRESEELGLFK